MPDATIHETYSNVGNALKNREKLVVAKVETSLNEIPEFFRSFSYPRLLYLPEYNKYKYFTFEGKTITVESVLKFVEDSEVKAKEAQKPEETKPKEEETKAKEEEMKPGEEKKDL